MTREKIIADMNAAAKANLEPSQMAAYALYRDTLDRENGPDDELEDCLRGWIWETSEEAADDD